MDQGTLIRTALGRTANLGDLYDARNDKFVGVPLIGKSIPPGPITLLDNNFSKVEFLSSDSNSEKFKKLDVNAELKVSILLGLFSLEGSGRYLQETQKNSKVKSCSLIYNITTKDESVNLFHEDLKDSFIKESLSMDTATHVLTKITWGANTIISAGYKCIENQEVNKKKIDRLNFSLQKIKFQISGNVKGEMASEDKDDYSSFSLKIFGDVLTENEELPQTFEDALNLMKKMPQLVRNANNGKGKPLVFTFVPLSILQNFLQINSAQIFKSLTETILLKIDFMFEELELIKQELNDFHSDSLEYKNCIEQTELEEILRFNKNFLISESTITSELASILVKVRSGKQDEIELDNWIKKFQKEDCSLEKFKDFKSKMSTVWEKLKLVRFFIDSEVIYVGRGDSLETVFLNHSLNEIYILYYSFKHKNDSLELWNQTQSMFSSYLSKHNEKRTFENGKEKKFVIVDLDLNPQANITQTALYCRKDGINFNLKPISSSYFIGKYELTHSEYFDEFLYEIGVGYFSRTYAHRNAPSIYISQQGDVISYKTITSMQTNEIKFKFGEQFNEETADGRKCKSIIKVESNIWTQEQKWNGKECTIYREFVGNEMRMVLCASHVSAKRNFRKVNT